MVSPPPTGSPADELKQAVRTGQVVQRGNDDSAADGEQWGEDRHLPANLLHELLAVPANRETSRAAVLVGLRITGHLDLEAAEVHAPLIAQCCWFDEPLNLRAAHAPEVSLIACQAPGIMAIQLQTDRDLYLRNSTFGVVNLTGGHIGGNLVLRGVTLTGGEYPLDLGDATLRPPDPLAATFWGNAFVGDGVHVDGHVFCHALTADGVVSLVEARVGGLLMMAGAALNAGEDIRPALSLQADRIRVGGGMYCVEGYVEQSAGDVVGEEDTRRPFVAKGTVELTGARIGGDLNFDGATLRQGLNADRLDLGGTLSCRKTRAEKTLRLSDARIGNGAHLDGATLRGDLVANRVQVEGDMSCRKLRTRTAVRLVAARVSGDVVFDGATITKRLDAAKLGVDGDMAMHFARGPRELDLSAARLGAVLDSESTWPEVLRIRGCVYGAVHAHEDSAPRAGAEGAAGWSKLPSGRWRRRSPDVERRLTWIVLAQQGRRERPDRWWRRDPGSRPDGEGFAPQPYTQLIDVYRRGGRDDDARRVAYCRECARRGQRHLPGKAWNAFLRWTVGYGYRPLRALWWLVALVVLGSVVFSSLHAHGEITPTDEDHAPFVASIYTLDRLLPIVSFGLRDSFAAHGAAQWWAFTYTLMGWALSAAVVAGLNAAVRRD